MKKNIASGGQPSSIDWAYIYWRLQLYFPHDPRFSAQNFAFTPIKVIFQALEYGQRFYKEDKHYQELGIATLTSYFVNANKDPKKGKKVSPSDFFFFKPETISSLDPDIAATFFYLAKQRLIPSWLPACVPMSEFLALKGQGKIKNFKALTHESLNVYIICPEVSQDYLFCAYLAISDLDEKAHRYLVLHDVEEPSRKFKVVTPPNAKDGKLTLLHANYYLQLISQYAAF